MKKIILLSVALILLGVLLIVYIPFTPSAPKVGADRDSHGCIASAGYTYSVLRKGCVRLWEEGIALAPVAAMANPGLVAYVVQNPAGNKAEVFLPGQVGSMVLTAQANPNIATWVGRQGYWVLTYDPAQGWQLSADGDVLYAAIAGRANRDKQKCMDSDESAFSVLKNKCVDLLKEGFVLLEVGEQNDLSKAAHCIMSGDYKQIEVFLPDEKSSFVLTRSGQEWKDEHNQWRLVRHPAKFGEQELWELFEKDTLRFEGRPVVTVFLD